MGPHLPSHQAPPSIYLPTLEVVHCHQGQQALGAPDALPGGEDTRSDAEQGRWGHGWDSGRNRVEQSGSSASTSYSVPQGVVERMGPALERGPPGATIKVHVRWVGPHSHARQAPPSIHLVPLEMVRSPQG